MRRHFGWGFVGIVCLFLVAATVAPVAAGAAARPDAAGIRLAYRFQPGAVYRYHCSVTGTMTLGLGPGGPAAGPAPGGMPMNLTMECDLVRTVKSVAADGSAVVEQRLDNAVMTNRMMGMEMVWKAQNGKTTMTMNGQPVAMPATGMGADPLASQVLELRLASTGQVLELKTKSNQAAPPLAGGVDMAPGAGMPMGGLGGAGMAGFAMAALGGLILPAEPVTVGQHWSESTTPAPPAPPGAPGGAPVPLMPIQRESTLKELRREGTRQIVVIESKMTMTTPGAEVAPPGQGSKSGPGPVRTEPSTQTNSGTYSFDVTGGVLQKSEQTTRMSMRMALPGAPDAAPKPGSTMEVNYVTKLALLPDAAAGAAR
jgi:hypothetical protein